MKSGKTSEFEYTPEIIKKMQLNASIVSLVARVGFEPTASGL